MEYFEIPFYFPGMTAEEVDIVLDAMNKQLKTNQEIRDIVMHKKHILPKKERTRKYIYDLLHIEYKE